MINNLHQLIPIIGFKKKNYIVNLHKLSHAGFSKINNIWDSLSYLQSTTFEGL